MNHNFNGDIIAGITLVFLFFLTYIFLLYIKMDNLENKIIKLEKQILIYKVELK